MPLRRALTRPEIGEATRAHLTALAQAAQDEAADRFAALLIDGADTFVRESALTYLARCEAAFPAEALAMMVRAHDAALRNAAIETLAALGERALDALAPLLADADVDVRIYALTALTQTQSPRAGAVALHVALTDPDVKVCGVALDVIAACGRRREAARIDEVVARFPGCSYLLFAAKVVKAKIG